MDNRNVPEITPKLGNTPARPAYTKVALEVTLKPVSYATLIDVLYRDTAGWHVVGIHLREVSGRDPWADRKPGLAAAAWAVREQLGEAPRTVGLLDLVTGEVRSEPVRKLKFPACFAQVVSSLRRWTDVIKPRDGRPGAFAVS